jgi:CRP/FNR family transcriptional regulator, cyclic AMP receptor protein
MMNSLAINAFLRQFKPILYRRKERIVIPGVETDNIYYIIQGYVMQNIISANGNQFTPYIFAPDTFFPLILWKDNSISNIDNYEYESLTPVEVYRIPKEKLISYLQENPNATLALNKQLAAYSSELLLKLETKVFNNAIRMIILRLLDLAKLFGKKQTKDILIEYWFTHQDIANISGLSREVVTIQMNYLIRKKIIAYKNHFIIINNLNALEMELQSEG